MSIINKLRRTEEPHLPVHEFSWVLQLWLLGDLTMQEAGDALAVLVPGFVADANEITQMTAIKTKFDAASATEKVRFLLRFEGAAQLLRAGAITVAKFKSIMGIATD